MVRFITDILDVKNLLGMQRIIPEPAYPVNETVMRFSGTTYNFNVVAGSSFDITRIYNGHPVTLHYTNPGNYTGNMDEGTDIIVTGATDIEPGSGCNFVAFGNDLTAIRISSVWGVLFEMDLRNAGDVHSFYTYSLNVVYTIYANAQYADLANFTQSVIEHSTMTTNGVLWIDPTEAYAASVITAAQTKGWTVYNL